MRTSKYPGGISGGLKHQVARMEAAKAHGMSISRLQVLWALESNPDAGESASTRQPLATFCAGRDISALVGPMANEKDPAFGRVRLARRAGRRLLFSRAELAWFR